MKWYALLNRTVLVVFLCLLYTNTKSQEKKKILLELSGNPVETSFKKDDCALSFNMGLSCFVADKLNIGLQFRNTYELNKDIKTYNSLSSAGVSVGYNFFPNTENSFLKDGSFELMTDIGGGYFNSNRDVYFFYGSLSCRVYFRRIAFVGIGYNHKWYNEDAVKDKINRLFFVFGFRF